MLSAALIALVAASSVFADPTPTFPGPTDSFTAGGVCSIEWTADATKKWTTMNIQLMTGINSKMTAMRTVATVDATTTTSFNWTCPEVDPPAPIYFYQFSTPTAPTDLLWVTRFLIKGTDGSSVAAPLTDPNGIAYGNGVFVDTSLYTGEPTYLDGNGQVVGSGNTTTTGSSTTSASGATVTGTTTRTSTALTGTTTNSVTKITSPTSSSSTTSAHTTTSSGASAASFVSSSWGAMFGALMAITAVTV